MYQDPQTIPNFQQIAQHLRQRQQQPGMGQQPIIQRPQQPGIGIPQQPQQMAQQPQMGQTQPQNVNAFMSAFANRQQSQAQAQPAPQVTPAQGQMPQQAAAPQQVAPQAQEGSGDQTQRFIEAATKQGIPTPLIMQFLSQKLGFGGSGVGVPQDPQKRQQ